MQPLRFVHAADLHLDAPFSGLSMDSPEFGRGLRQATFEAWESLVNLCVEQKADFLLIAGDVYNQEDRSILAQLRFRDGLNELSRAGVCVYVAHGNHDPLGSAPQAIQWPDNVWVFESDEPQTFSFVREGQTLALIHGASHMRTKETRNLARKFSSGDNATFQVGLLHCNLGRNTGHEPYAPCDWNDLLYAGMDYWALGHIHKGGVWCESPHVVYPGNIQGLNIRENGPRGCYVVHVHAGGEISPVFHPLDTFRWSWVDVDAGSVDKLDQLEDKVLAAVEQEQANAGTRGIVCRVSLYGRGPVHGFLSSQESRDDFLYRLREQTTGNQPPVWIKDVQVNTAPDIDLEERREKHDFLGQVLTQARSLRERKDLAQFLLEEVLSDLFSHRRARKFLSSLSTEEAEELLRQSELLALDKLEPGQEE